MNRTVLQVLACAFAMIGCGESRPPADDTGAIASRCRTEARRTVEELGHRMRLVSLLGPDTTVRREMRVAYAPLVTEELLRDWQRSPASAPGRQLSSPWPARIDVREVQPADTGCRVDGDVVYVTSADTNSPVERRPVTLNGHETDKGWRVSSYQTVTVAERSDSAGASPADVVRHYYDLIRARNYEAAYALWGEAGEASGQSRAAFARGFGKTAQVRTTIADSVRIEGAAGSQYATVPVQVDAVLRDGTQQHFAGTYTLRRSMVDGATPEQRRWQIYAAHLEPADSRSQ